MGNKKVEGGFAKFIKNLIIFVVILAIIIFGTVFVSKRLKTLPEESKMIANLESYEYEIAIKDEISEEYLAWVLDSIINKCNEHGVSTDIHAAFKYYIGYAYDDYDNIDKILIAQRGRIKAKESINNWETSTDYFNTGIVVFYFNSEDSAESFYSECEWAFEAISVYYDRSIHNLFDEKVVHAQKGNVVYIGSDITFETACGRLNQSLFNV